METQPLDQLTKIINDALNGTAKLRKSFKTFFVTTSILFLSMTKRKYFTQMALFNDCSESRFRQNCGKKFDWWDITLLSAGRNSATGLPSTSIRATFPSRGLSIFTAIQSSLPGSPIACHGRGHHWTLRSTCHSPLPTWRGCSRSCGINLSVSNVKTLIHNADMIQRFIRMSGKRPHRLLYTNDFKGLLFYGVSDAAWLAKFQRTIVS